MTATAARADAAADMVEIGRWFVRMIDVSWIVAGKYNCDVIGENEGRARRSICVVGIRARYQSERQFWMADFPVTNNARS